MPEIEGQLRVREPLSHLCCRFLGLLCLRVRPPSGPARRVGPLRRACDVFLRARVEQAAKAGVRRRAIARGRAAVYSLR